MFNDAGTLSDESKSFEGDAMDAQQAANGVLNGGSWVGKSADAAYEAYKEAVSIKFRQAEISKVASGLFKRAGEDVASIKKHMPQNFTVARVLLWRSAGRQLCRGFEAGGRRRRRVSCGDAGSFIPGVVTPFLGSRGHRGLWVRVWRGPC